MRKFLSFVFVVYFISGCATVGLVDGPTVVKTYTDDLPRNQIAVLRVQQRGSFSIFACDDMSVYRNTQYVLLLPGRHVVGFHIGGETLVEGYMITNRKYMDAVAGHTYVLRTKGAGIITVGDKWYPEVFDITDDPQLKVITIPISNDK